MPLSTQVTSTPSTVSRTCPVGSSAPVAEPSVSANASTTGAAVPGTPAIAASPRYSTRPPGVGKVADGDAVGVDHADAHAGLAVRRPGTSPRSTANGPTPARMLPQFCRSLTVGLVDAHCRNR